MSTDNHTQIEYGAPIDTPVVNAPLGQLDAAIGNRLNLTTTQKASLVAALNEVKNLLDTKKLDDLAQPDDNTDLNASTARHGLLPKLNGDANSVLGGDGTWVPGGGSGSSSGHIIEDNGTPMEQRSTLNFTGDAVDVSDDGVEGKTIVHITSNPVGGSSGQVQFNDGGEMAGDVDLTFDQAANMFSIGVSTGAGKMQIGYSGSAAPDTPGAGTGLLYIPPSGKLHFKNAAAEDIELGETLTVSDGDALSYTGIKEIQYPDLNISQPSTGIVQVVGGYNPFMAEFFM